jgi:hypothetical protein
MTLSNPFTKSLPRPRRTLDNSNRRPASVRKDWESYPKKTPLLFIRKKYVRHKENAGNVRNPDGRFRADSSA